MKERDSRGIVEVENAQCSRSGVGKGAARQDGGSLHLRPDDGQWGPEMRVNTIRATILKALGGDDFGSLRLLLPQYAKELELLLRDGSASAAKLQHLETEHARFYEQLRASLLTNRIRVRLELERVHAARRYQGEADIVPLVATHG